MGLIATFIVGLRTSLEKEKFQKGLFTAPLVH